MPFNRNMLTAAVVCLLLLLFAGALLLSGEEGEAGPSGGVARRTDRGARVIRVDLNLYTPGTVPQGIGEPVKVAAELAREWEAANPGYRIEFTRLINTGSTEGEWLKTQLIGGIAPEIISINAESAWPDVDKGWYVPLDEFMERPSPYAPDYEQWIDTFRNQALVGAKRAADGRLYCVPMDVVETGLFYNKTMLDELGVNPEPATWTEMLAGLDNVQAANLVPQTSDGNLAANWGLDIIFEMLYHDILPKMDLVRSRADSEAYLGHYLDPSEAGFLFTKGFFTRRDPRWREVHAMLLDWRRRWAVELKNTDPVRLFLTGRLATYWSGSWFIRRMATDPYVDFEWGVAYLPTITEGCNRYGSGTPATVIGGAAVQLHVTNSALGNDVLEECIDFIMFLTAPQNIERLTAEALVFFPNIVDTETDERLAAFEEIFARPYCAIKWMESLDGQYKHYWSRMSDYFLEGGVDLDEYLVMMEENFAGWVESHRGDAAWDFEAMEAVWREREADLLKELDPPLEGNAE